LSRIDLLITVAALLTSTVAFADSVPASTEASPPERISFLVTFGDEKCPDAARDEIVVCAKAPESERYRIPKELRGGDEKVPSSMSWAAASQVLDEYSRAGRINSCSVNGSAGFTGCTQAMLRQWFAERQGLSKSN
jgi:hypothetical protein